MLETIAKRFNETAPAVDYWTLRLVRGTTNVLSVRQNVVEPPTTYRDAGAMVTVLEGGGLGYGATSDLTPQGLAAAFEAAREWATAGANLISPQDYPWLVRKGEYHYEGEIPWDAWSLGQKMELLRAASQSLKIRDDISDWYAFLVHTRNDILLVSSYGGWIEQLVARMQPVLGVVANRGAETQNRGFGRETFFQGGLEHLARTGFPDMGEKVAQEALYSLDAPTCPTGVTDLVLMPSQMVIQLHESIGHPLELDRILGDERTTRAPSS